jgi:hypothetical protein
MAFGDVILATVGYTAGDLASKRKFYPIKRKYKQKVNKQNPVFPSDYEAYPLNSTQQYWFPYSSIAPTDFNHIPYTPGDEYAWNDNEELRPSELIIPNPNLRKYKDYEAGTRIVYANEVYVATVYYFTWASTSFSQNLNPYLSNRVRKWKKLSDTAEVWTQYWYHPFLRRFYLLADIDELQELPDFDEPDASIWDEFIGDAADLNIDNFTLARIRELISQGTAPATATALVESLNTPASVEDASTSSTGSLDAPTGTITFSLNVKKDAPGQEGETSEQNSNLPIMFQRYTNSNTGQKTEIDQYPFNLRPNNVSYTNIGANWIEVDRVNNFPLLDYRNQKLMKIAFEFVVEAHSGSISSIYESCEDKLRKLSTMASRSDRVQFVNFDSLFGDKVKVGTLGENAHEFAIVDFSINSVQRTYGDGNSVRGEISRATVNMTVQQVRIDNAEIIFMPKLTKIPKGGGGGGGGGGGDPDLCPLLSSQTVVTYIEQKPSCRVPPKVPT